MSSGTSVANDALFVQLVRGSFGQNAETRGLSKPNISSCSFVITLHDCVRVSEERSTIEETVRWIPSVRDVVNKMIVQSQ